MDHLKTKHAYYFFKGIKQASTLSAVIGDDMLKTNRLQEFAPDLSDCNENSLCKKYPVTWKENK